MEKGLAIIEQNETETKAVFIDHEVIECARLNMRVKKRMRDAQKAQKDNEQKHRKAEAVAAQFRVFTLKTIYEVLIRGGVIVAAVWAGMSALVSPVITIPVILFCLCTIFLKIGVWFGKKV